MAAFRTAALLVAVGAAEVLEDVPEEVGEVPVAATLVDTGVAAALVAFVHEMLVGMVKLSASVISAH